MKLQLLSSCKPLKLADHNPQEEEEEEEEEEEQEQEQEQEEEEEQEQEDHQCYEVFTRPLSVHNAANMCLIIQF